MPFVFHYVFFYHCNCKKGKEKKNKGRKKINLDETKNEKMREVKLKYHSVKKVPSNEGPVLITIGSNL